MGIFNFLKKDEDNDKVPQRSEEPYSELSTGLDDFENPSWSQVESAVSDVQEAEDSFATLSFKNYGLEVDTIQCIKSEAGYTLEVLPAMDSKEYGSIYHLDGISYEDVLKRFEEFYEHQTVTNYKSFVKDKFQMP